MKIHTARIIGFLPFLLLFVCGSCTQFFSTSLAPWASRDPDKLVRPVTVDNVNDLIDEAASSPDLSLAVLKKINEAFAGANAGDTAVLQASALQAAANAVGLGSAILSQAGNITSALQSQDKAIELVIGTVNGLKNLQETGSTLTAILPEPGTQAFDDFVDKASAEDIAITAALILLAAESQRSRSPEDYLADFDPSDLSALNQQELMAVELAKAAAGKGLDGPLNDLLNGLNLAQAPAPPPGP